MTRRGPYNRSPEGPDLTLTQEDVDAMRAQETLERMKEHEPDGVGVGLVPALALPEAPPVKRPLYLRLVEASTLEHRVAAEVLAFSVCDHIAEIMRLRKLAKQPTGLGGDEARALAGLHSNLRRSLSDLGLLEHIKKNQDSGFDAEAI